MYIEFKNARSVLKYLTYFYLKILSEVNSRALFKIQERILFWHSKSKFHGFNVIPYKNSVLEQATWNIQLVIILIWLMYLTFQQMLSLLLIATKSQ